MRWGWLVFLACCSQPTALVAPPVDCSLLTEAACAAEAACQPVNGQPVHGDHDCEDPGPLQFAACMPVEEDCSDIPVYQAPSSAPDSCWHFGSACDFDGWGRCAPRPHCDDSGNPD